MRARSPVSVSSSTLPSVSPVEGATARGSSAAPDLPDLPRLLHGRTRVQRARRSSAQEIWPTRPSACAPVHRLQRRTSALPRQRLDRHQGPRSRFTRSSAKYGGNVRSSACPDAVPMESLQNHVPACLDDLADGLPIRQGDAAAVDARAPACPAGPTSTSRRGRRGAADPRRPRRRRRIEAVELRRHVELDQSASWSGFERAGMPCTASSLTLMQVTRKADHRGAEPSAHPALDALPRPHPARPW